MVTTKIEIDLNKVAKRTAEAMVGAAEDVGVDMNKNVAKFEKYFLKFLLDSPVEAFENAIATQLGEELLSKVYEEE